MAVTIEQMLAAARVRLRRLDPGETADAVAAGALLVDIRPAWQRAAEGAIPGALLIERNHLEWRLDPTSDSRIPAAVDHDVAVVVVCSEGYTSSLAAASLQDLGLHRGRRVPGMGGGRAAHRARLTGIVACAGGDRSGWAAPTMSQLREPPQ